MVIGGLLSYWEGNFSGAMLNFGKVNRNRPIDNAEFNHIGAGPAWDLRIFQRRMLIPTVKIRVPFKKVHEQLSSKYCIIDTFSLKSAPLYFPSVVSSLLFFLKKEVTMIFNMKSELIFPTIFDWTDAPPHLWLVNQPPP